MLYKKGDIVFYKKYVGRIVTIYDYNKSYGVELAYYRGQYNIIKQIDQNLLQKNEQLTLI
jgi:hypothetical protein